MKENYCALSTYGHIMKNGVYKMRTNREDYQKLNIKSFIKGVWNGQRPEIKGVIKKWIIINGKRPRRRPRQKWIDVFKLKLRECAPG